VGNAFYVSVA